MNKFFLKNSLLLGADAALKGELEGVAYSGKQINDFCGYDKFVIDLSTLTIAKEKSPLLKDHMTEFVVGVATVENDLSQLTLKGKISNKTEKGRDILSLSEDGVEWELSVGVFEGFMEDDFSGNVNGEDLENVSVLRNGVLREVSVVALGADSNTKTIIMSKKQESKMNEKQFKKLLKVAKLAEDSDVNEVISKVEEFVEKVNEADQEAVDKEALIEELKSQIAELTSQLEAIAEEAEAEQREGEAEASLKEKGIILSKEKIKEISRTKATFDIFMSAFSEVKVEKKIDVKFSKKIEIGKEEKEEATLNLRDRANALLKSGEAKTFTEAILKLNKKEEV